MRPSEGVRSPYSKLKFGIRFLNIIKDTIDGSHKFISVKLFNHKTSKNNNDPKLAYLPDTFCGNPNCDCVYLNPYKFVSAFIQRRQHLTKLYNKSNLFTWENNNPVVVGDITKLVKDIVRINKIPTKDVHRYTAYSFRIGGATRATAVGIDHMLILKFVGWADTFLSDSSISYIRPSTDLLITIPFKMIHGINNKIEQNTSEFLNKGLVFDPWTKSSFRKR